MGKPSKSATTRWIKNKADEHAADNGHYFDEATANRVVTFFEEYLRHTKGEWAGRPFRLTSKRVDLPKKIMKFMGETSDWQRHIIMRLFGWKRRDGFRRFRKGYLRIARKNGKSETCAGVAAYGAAADGEQAAEVYCAATDREQAAIVYEAAKSMIQSSPELDKYAKCFRRTISIDRTRSFIRVLSADAPSKHGFNSHMNIIDELHAHKSRDLFDILSTGTSARRQPLTLSITTAGSDQNTICYEQDEYAQKILSHTIYDDSFFAFIAEAPKDSDWSDPVNWALANPNLGVCKKLDYLQEGFNVAKETPAAENTFRRLELNQWVQQVSRWINLDLWDSQGGKVNEMELLGRPCYGGLDLASVSDLCAWVMIFENDDDSIDVLPRFWCPKRRLYAQDNKYKDQYQAWARDGYLTATEGDAVDYDFIRAQILEDSKKFNVQSLNVDRLFQGYDMAMKLADELGEEKVLTMGMGFISFATPMKEFEKLLLSRKIRHGGHPVLRWMADNVAVRTDPAGNLKPDKENSQGKIDGIVALVMGIDRRSRQPAVVESVYENRGIVYI